MRSSYIYIYTLAFPEMGVPIVIIHFFNGIFHDFFPSIDLGRWHLLLLSQRHHPLLKILKSSTMVILWMVILWISYGYLMVIYGHFIMSLINNSVDVGW